MGAGSDRGGGMLVVRSVSSTMTRIAPGHVAAGPRTRMQPCRPMPSSPRANPPTCPTGWPARSIRSRSTSRGWITARARIPPSSDAPPWGHGGRSVPDGGRLDDERSPTRWPRRTRSCSRTSPPPPDPGVEFIGHRATRADAVTRSVHGVQRVDARASRGPTDGSTGSRSPRGGSRGRGRAPPPAWRGRGRTRRQPAAGSSGVLLAPGSVIRPGLRPGRRCAGPRWRRCWSAAPPARRGRGFAPPAVAPAGRTCGTSRWWSIVDGPARPRRSR